MKVHSIFQSLNGEVTSSYQGSVCTFIRLQGCRLSCSFCDTNHSQDPNGGTEISPSQIENIIYKLPISTKNITITGGEPLEQKEELIELCNLLWPIYRITLETNGAHLIPKEVSATTVSIVMDIKPESSQISNYRKYLKNAKSYALELGSSDWIKFPILTFFDFVTADNTMIAIEEKWAGYDHPNFALSAVLPLTPKKLYNWIVERKLGDVILNCQLHKLLRVA